jgi:hypothetical protein
LAVDVEMYLSPCQNRKVNRNNTEKAKKNVFLFFTVSSSLSALAG